IFRSIRVEKLVIYIHRKFTISFLREITSYFKPDEIIIHATSKNLITALQVMDEFPGRKHSLVFNALPAKELLCSLSSLHGLAIM
ncbi:hypothetical protein PENTCL1PPCAC_20506, partial [Pristionchus entomophagus]